MISYHARALKMFAIKMNKLDIQNQISCPVLRLQSITAMGQGSSSVRQIFNPVMARLYLNL